MMLDNMTILVIIVFIMCAILFCFFLTYNVTKTYVKEQHIISDNLETLITSVEMKNQRDFRDYVIAVKEGDDIVYHSCFLVTDINMNVDVIVPDNLYSELDYKEKYRPC